MTTRYEEEKPYRADFNVYNQQLLDQNNEGDDEPVKSHYSVADKLGMVSTACLIINRMIGTGIFLTPSTVLRGTESVGTSLAFWCIGALIALSGLLVYLELGLTIPRRRVTINGERLGVYVPRSGGEKNYLEWIYRRPKYAASCVYAVVFVILGNTAANSLAFSEYILIAFNNPKPSLWVQKAYALVAITLACLLHGVWRAGGIYVINIFAFYKLLVLLFIIGLGFAVRGGAFGGDKLTLSNIDPKVSFDNGARAPYGYAVALLAIRFSYGGFENAHYVLSDIDKPRQRLKYSTLAALGLVSVLYVLTNFAYLLVVPRGDIIEAGTRISYLYFNRIFGKDSQASRAIPAVIALSAFGNLIAVTFVSAKVKQEIAKEGVLPFSKFWSQQYKFRLFSRDTSRDNQNGELGPVTGETPIPALFLHWIVSVVLVLAPQTPEGYILLSQLYSYTIQACIGLLLAGGLLYMRYFRSKKKADSWRQYRGFTPWLGPLFPAFYFVANLAMVVSPWIHPPGSKPYVYKAIRWFVFPTVGFSAFGIGLVYWAVFWYIVPKIKSKVLRVKIVPYFDRDAFVLEAVYSKWVVEGGEDDPEEDDESVSI